MNVSDLHKSNPVVLQTISPDQTILQAIVILCRHNIGALPVLDVEGSLVGILTERDVLRLCSRENQEAALKEKVRDIMTVNLVICVAGDGLDYVMRVMTERRVRHLPVLEGRKLVAIISIGDVVKAQYEQQETEIRYLRDYMQGALA